MLSFVVSPALLLAVVAAVGVVLVTVSGCVVSPLLLLPVAVLPVAIVEVLATSAHAETFKTTRAYTMSCCLNT